MLKYEQIFNDNDRKKYIKDLWSITEPILKSIVRDKDSQIRYSSTERSSSSSTGYKREITLSKDNKHIVFAVELLSWNWVDGSISINVELKDANNLVIPKRRIPKQKNTEVWKPSTGKDRYFFIRTFEPVYDFINALNLTMIDANMFDNIEQLIRNFFK